MNKGVSGKACGFMRKDGWVPGLTAAALAVMGSLSLSAADASIEERLKNIEKQVEALQKENADLKQQLKEGDSSKGRPAFVKALGKESKLSLGGYIQTQFEAGNAPDSRFSANDRFLIRRARLNLSGSIYQDFAFKLEGEFGNSNLKNNASYRAQATDAYLEWTRYNFAKIRVGQFKTTFGYEQLQSDPLLTFAERSIASDVFTISRQVGASVSGDYYNKRLGYTFGAFNGPASNNGFNDNEKFTYSGRLTGTPWKGKIGGWESSLSFGVNGYISKDNAVSLTNFGFDSVAGGAVDDLFTGDRRVWGADTQFHTGPFDFVAEYFRGHFKPKDAIPVKQLNADGFYVSGAAFLVPKKLQAAVRFETVDPNKSVSGNSSDVWSFGLNYYIKDHDVKLQLNYLLGNQAGFKDNQGRIIARAQIMF